MSKRVQKQVSVLSRKKRAPDTEELSKRYWVRSHIQAQIEGHVVDADADEVFQIGEIITPDQLTQLKFDALEHRQDEIMTKLLELSDKIEQAPKPRSREVSLERIKNSFSRIDIVKGIYALSTQDGYEIAITYPESIRLGEALKKLVPIEVELSKKYKNTPIDFEYIPAGDFSTEMKSSFKVLLERKGPSSSAE